MAHQSYNEAMKDPQEIILFAPDGREINGYYCDPKIDRSTLPSGWHAYDIRHDDECLGIFCTLNHNYVNVNNAGTVFLEGEIPELTESNSSVDFEIDEDEWLMAHGIDPDDPDADKSDIDPLPEQDHNKTWGYTFS